MLLEQMVGIRIPSSPVSLNRELSLKLVSDVGNAERMQLTRGWNVSAFELVASKNTRKRVTLHPAADRVESALSLPLVRFPLHAREFATDSIQFPR